MLVFQSGRGCPSYSGDESIVVLLKSKAFSGEKVWIKWGLMIIFRQELWGSMLRNITWWTRMAAFKSTCKVCPRTLQAYEMETWLQDIPTTTCELSQQVALVLCDENISWTPESKDWSGKYVYHVSAILNIWVVTGEFNWSTWKLISIHGLVFWLRLVIALVGTSCWACQ